MKNSWIRFASVTLVVTGIAMGQAVAQSITQSAKQAWGGENSSEKWQDGTVGYTLGCSVAASFGVPACGELPSGKKTIEDQEKAELNAAIEGSEKLKADAATVEAESARALQALQQQGAQTSAVAAALQQTQQAAANLVATTPDPQDIADAMTPPPPAKVPAYTFAQRIVAWGIEGIPSSETQNTPPPADQANAHDDSDGQSDGTDDTMDQYGAAQQQYQQSLQTLHNSMPQTPAWRNIPAQAQVQSSRGAQYRGCTQYCWK